MNSDCRPSAASPAAPTEGSPRVTKRRIDGIDEPARPLGAKRAALQGRRLRAPQPVVRAAARNTGIGSSEMILASRNNSITFNLRATAMGLLIERTQVQPVGARLIQMMVFADPTTFERWCASEPIRFEDAVLYDQLRREGHEARGGKR